MERQNRNPNKKSSPGLKLGVLGAAAIVGAGVYGLKADTAPEVPAVNAPHREYEVRAGDTVSGILQTAFRDKDWRSLTDYVENQLPADRENHTLQPGDKLIFGPEAEIGQLVDPANQDASAQSG